MKPGNLNFLEPSGPLQACNGTTLPFYWSLIPGIDPYSELCLLSFLISSLHGRRTVNVFDHVKVEVHLSYV